MVRLRVLGLASVLWLLCGTAWADKIAEPPREQVLTGTLSWESIKNRDGSTKEKRLVLIVEKDKESKIYLPVTSGTNVKATKAGDGVILRYAHGDASAKVFVRPLAGPDTPLRKVQVGKPSLLTARRSNLLIAIENGPSNPVEGEAWVGSFVSP